MVKVICILIVQIVIFTFTHNKLLKKVMAFINKGNIVTNKEDLVSNTNINFNQPERSNDLTLAELEFLLIQLKSAMIKGEHIELAYNLILKLQDQYIKLQ